MEPRACTLASLLMLEQTETETLHVHMNQSRRPSDDVVLFAGARSWIKSSVN